MSVGSAGRGLYKPRMSVCLQCRPGAVQAQDVCLSAGQARGCAGNTTDPAAWLRIDSIASHCNG